MRIYTLLPLLLIISLMAQAMLAKESQASATGQSGDILLNGTNLIKAPKINFIMPGLNWTYPYSYYPIYSENQTISGRFLGPDQMAGTNVKLCISTFNLLRFMNASAIDLADGRCNVSISPIGLNSTGDGEFIIQGPQSGTYTLSAIDALNSTVISALPLIIAAEELSINSSAKVPPGGVLEATITSPRSDNITRYYGAVMVPRKDYEELKLSIAINGSQRNISSTMAFGNRSLIIQGLPSISMDLLMKMSTILPQNSAIAMQVSNESGADLYLMTDPGLERGSYILTCVVYSPGKGILGMRQIPVEVS